jgi:hypothetical protein
MIPFFGYLVHFLYSLGLNLVAPSVGAKNNHARKHVKLSIKIYGFIFTFFFYQNIDA